MGRNVSGARAIACLLVLSAWGAGCSLINSYSDVAPQRHEPDAMSNADTGAPMPDASTDGPLTVPEAAMEAAPPEAAVDAGPRGAIVIGGSAAADDASEQYVLTAVDPVTGSELPNAREPLTVAAVLYDGPRDLWYVFESGGQGIFPLPTDPFYLRTRRLDVVSGQWTELGKVAVPPGLSFATTAVLGQRVSYVAYAAADAGTLDGGTPVQFQLVTLDTSDPAAVTVASTVDLASAPVALVGTRSAVSAAGGFATLAGTTTVGTSHVAQLTPVLLPSTDPPSVELPIVGIFSVGGQTGFGAVLIGGTQEVAVVARGFGGSTTPATVSVFDPASNDPAQALVGAGSFAFGDGNIKNPAYSACAQTLFVVGTNADLNLYAVSLASLSQPVDGGAQMLSSVSIPTGHSGQGVYFEPFTSTVIVPFSQGNNFALTAFSFAGGQLLPRQAPRWVPPADLRPNFIATRNPSSFSCPMQTEP